MKIYNKPINKNEVFCCSLKAAKAVFNDTEISLNFAGLGRSFAAFAESPIWYYVKRNVKGNIIAELNMTGGFSTAAILSFYVFNNNVFSKEIIELFEGTYLYKLYHIYQEASAVNNCNKNKLAVVELYDGQLKLHDVWL